MSKKRGRPRKASLPLGDAEYATPMLENPYLIEVGQEELEQTKADLREFYIKRGYKGDAEAKIEKVIASCIAGWERCPKNFQQRIDKKTQRQTQNWKHLEDVNLKRKKVAEEKLRLDDITEQVLEEEGLKTRPKSNYSDVLIGGISLDDLLTAGALGEEERLFYLEREAAYHGEFDFNTSSDEALLQQIITDELIMRRARFAILSGKSLADEPALDKISARLRENIIRLGISREQRERDRGGKGGNVAELSLRLEERLKAIAQLQDETKRASLISNILDKFADVTPEELYQYAEELHFLKIKEYRTKPNTLPSDIEADKLAKEIGVL